MWISFNKLTQYCGRWTKMYGCMAMHQNPPKPLCSPFWVADFHGCSSKTTYNNILGTIGFEWFWMVLTHPTSKLPRSRGRGCTCLLGTFEPEQGTFWPGMHRLWDFGSTVFLLGASAEEPIVSNVFFLLQLDHQWIPWLMIVKPYLNHPKSPSESIWK